MARRLCSLSSICGFRFHKQQVHQATGGIVNIDKSSTGSTPVFKPVMVTAINLYQLASTRPPVTRLMNFRRALPAGDPDSGFYHEASDSFLAKNQTVNFLQIFQRQRGAKITVVLPDYTEVPDLSVKLATDGYQRGHDYGCSCQVVRVGDNVSAAGCNGVA